MWIALSSLFATGIVIASIWVTMRAARTARTSQGALGWAIFLLSSPLFALPLYLVLGHHRYRGYLVTRRETEAVIEGVKEHATRLAPDPDASSPEMRPFEYCAGLPAVRGNAADLLIDGRETFQSIFAAIDAAQAYVLIQFYIIRSDKLGNQLADHLIAAARRGVTVRLMCDAVGSFRLSRGYLDRLRAEGIQIAEALHRRGPRFRFQINYRNHRKTVIVDGRLGFTGGLNVGDEYLGHDSYFGPWRDTHLRIRGPIVAQLQLIFLEDWHWITGQLQLSELLWITEPVPEDMTALVVATGPADIGETGTMMIFSAIAQARDRIWLASPYFVPDIDIIRALRHAALRGVDVRLIIPDKIDHMLPWLAAFAYFDTIREAGARVFRYQDGFMHQKVFVVDDRIAGVGTTNLDNRSFRLNFEAMAVMFDTDMAERVALMLEQDMARCVEADRPLAEQPLWIRHGAPVARLFSPIL
jgi:cardiolipin synthase